MGNQRIPASKMTCPQCKTKLQPRRYDIGKGVAIQTMHCANCGFNVTEQNVLSKAISSLRSRLDKDVKVVAIGDGIGIRFPKELVDEYSLKKGMKIRLQHGEKGLELRL